jgi:hypothetical protein
MNYHTISTDGKKHSLHKGVSNVVDQIVIEKMHTMTLVLETAENFCVAKTQEVIVEMHDVGKGN